MSRYVSNRKRPTLARVNVTVTFTGEIVKIHYGRLLGESKTAVKYISFSLLNYRFNGFAGYFASIPVKCLAR